jgi:hypothetical protein
VVSGVFVPQVFIVLVLLQVNDCIQSSFDCACAHDHVV